jgi:hypothetical protein
MNRVFADIEFANHDDIVAPPTGHDSPVQVRRKITCAVVDRNSARTFISPQLAGELRLIATSTKFKASRPDGESSLLDQVEVCVRILGRDTPCHAIVEPGCTAPRLGFIVLDALDLIVDEEASLLVPRDPRYITCEL